MSSPTRRSASLSNIRALANSATRGAVKAHGHPNPAAPTTCGEPMGAGVAGNRRLDLRTRLLAWSGDAGSRTSS